MLMPCWRLPITSALLLLALGASIAPTKPAVADDTDVYPGRYVAVCAPAPIVGCTCRTNSLEQLSIFAKAASGVVGSDGSDLHDPEYLRMVEWVRRTCASLAQPENLR
jgi:hypothetical protein